MFREELEQREREHHLRSLMVIGSSQGPSVTIDGRSVLLFCSNDYLGLASHPALVQAAIDASRMYGFGTGASRLVSGTMSLHEELEARIAQFKGAESSILFNSGYAANTGVLPVLAGDQDAIFSDDLNHASIIDGCRLSRARTIVYRHCDMNDLEDRLRTCGTARRKLIVTDGVFSMDGDIAPLSDLLDLARRFDAILMVDDAHATGVLGGTGRGTSEHFNCADSVPVQMGTLGKALGSFGAYVAGDRDLIRYLVNSARSFIFSTALPPPVCAASLAAFSLVEQEPMLRERLWKNRERLVAGLSDLGIATAPSRTPIIPIIIGDPEGAVAASRRMLDLGLYAPAIRPPSVPAGSSRIRMTVSASHSTEDIDRALIIISQLREEGLIPHAD